MNDVMTVAVSAYQRFEAEFGACSACHSSLSPRACLSALRCLPPCMLARNAMRMIHTASRGASYWQCMSLSNMLSREESMLTSIGDDVSIDDIPVHMHGVHAKQTVKLQAMSVIKKT